MNDLVSIIIPCFNGEDFIDRSIRSVYEQVCSFQIELIVVNDGSSDQSEEKIRAWIPLFSHKKYILKYIYQANQGPGGAVNTGLKHVTGKYLSLLDADDEFLPGSLEKRIVYLEKNSDCVGVQSNGWQDKNGQRQLFDADRKDQEKLNLFDGLIGGKATNWAGSYMIRTRELFEFYPDREIYPSRAGQNMQLLLPVAYKRKFGYINEPLMIYYLRPDSLSQSSTEEQAEKEYRNFGGYYDIYVHMIRSVVHDEHEQFYYLNIVNSWKYRRDLSRAIQHRDKEGAIKAFSAYQATGYMTFNDEIEFCSLVKPVKAIWLRFYRRILKVLKRM